MHFGVFDYRHLVLPFELTRQGLTDFMYQNTFFYRIQKFCGKFLVDFAIGGFCQKGCLLTSELLQLSFATLTLLSCKI